MVASLVNVSAELAATVATGLGMPVPDALPKELDDPVEPEVTTSAALSLHALPGDGGVRTRVVAILLADGVDGASVATTQAALLAAGAQVRLVAARLGPVKPVKGEPIQAHATLENAPSVLFDGVVLPDGAAAVQTLGALMEVKDFIANQYRHGKTILALGASKALLEGNGVATDLPNGEADLGIVMATASSAAQGATDFIAALGQHRHPEREEPTMKKA
jgi:catalase